MNNKFNLKNTIFALTAILTIFFIAEYIYSKDYSILLLAVIIFSALVLICLFIYLLLLFDNRYKLTYADADELSDETKEKIIKTTRLTGSLHFGYKPISLAASKGADLFKSHRS